MIHPITAVRSRFYMWWLIWFLTGLGQSLLTYFISDLSLATAFSDGMISAILYSLLAITIWFPINQFSSQNIKASILIFNYVIVGIITIILWLFGTKFLVSVFIPDTESYNTFWNISFYYRLAAGAFIYAVIILSYHLMISMENINRKNMNEANLEKMLRETELMMLRSQINPHFLFNSLNSISSLTFTNPEKAREMVIKLSDFMRYALSKKEEKAVSLKKELENLRLYLEIEKVRFGDKLILEESIDEKYVDIEIPNMILQPLYENAIKHGVYESIDKVIIKFETLASNKSLGIRITNNYDPESIGVKGTGTGLLNVQRRLDLYYNKKAYLVTRKVNSKFIAEIFIPIEQKD